MTHVQIPDFILHLILERDLEMKRILLFTKWTNLIKTVSKLQIHERDPSFFFKGRICQGVVLKDINYLEMDLYNLHKHTKYGIESDFRRKQIKFDVY